MLMCQVVDAIILFMTEWDNGMEHNPERTNSGANGCKVLHCTRMRVHFGYIATLRTHFSIRDMRLVLLSGDYPVGY